MVHLFDAAINVVPYGLLCSLGKVGSSFITDGTQIFHLCMSTSIHQDHINVHNYTGFVSRDKNIAFVKLMLFQYLGFFTQFQNIGIISMRSLLAHCTLYFRTEFKKVP